MGRQRKRKYWQKREDNESFSFLILIQRGEIYVKEFHFRNYCRGEKCDRTKNVYVMYIYVKLQAYNTAESVIFTTVSSEICSRETHLLKREEEIRSAATVASAAVMMTMMMMMMMINAYI
jgi:hypothetical protein